MVDSNTHGERIKIFMGTVGISSADLAVELGVSRSTVSRWTNDTAMIPSEYLLVLAEKRSFDVMWYLTGVRSSSKIDVMAELRHAWSENDRLREELAKLKR